MLGMFRQRRTPQAEMERLANAAQRAPSPRRAIRRLRHALRIARKAGFLEAEADYAYRLGLLYRQQGAARKAETVLARAADIWEDMDKPAAAGDAALARAGVCLMDRRPAAARTFALVAQDRFRRAHVMTDRPQLARLLHAIDRMS